MEGKEAVTENDGQRITIPQDRFHMLVHGNALERLQAMPDGSVDCIVTSPPYYGLRLYSGAEAVWDGDAGCQHEWQTKNVGLLHENRNNTSGTQEEVHEATSTTFIRKFDSIEAGTCTRCGAWKGQLGLETDYRQYIAHLCKITAELKRVLKPAGTLWLNIGDSYSGKPVGSFNGGGAEFEGRDMEGIGTSGAIDKTLGGIPAKSLMQIPERLAIRMSDEQGWILRNVIIWRKLNHMPSSAKDRLANSYEFIYIFVQSRSYHFNLDNVRVPLAASTLKEIEEGYRGKSLKDYGRAKAQDASATKKRIIASYRSGNKARKTEQFRLTHLGSSIPWSAEDSPMGANPGDVVYADSQHGYNSKYGENDHSQQLQGFSRSRSLEMEREKSRVDATKLFPGDVEAQREYIKVVHDHHGHERGGNPGDILETSLQPHPFAHFAVFPSAIPEFCIRAGCPQNGVVLDPFAGSGTTGVVAWRMGLSSVMIEVSKEYCDLIRKRMGWGQQTLDGVRWIDLTGDDGNESWG